MKVPKGGEPLCSACAGTPGDLEEVLVSVKSMLSHQGPAKSCISQIRAVLKRRADRIVLRERNIDPAWGGR